MPQLAYGSRPEEHLRALQKKGVFQFHKGSYAKEIARVMRIPQSRVQRVAVDPYHRKSASHQLSLHFSKVACEPVGDGNVITLDPDRCWQCGNRDPTQDHLGR